MYTPIVKGYKPLSECKINMSVNVGIVTKGMVGGFISLIFEEQIIL